ncbi:hypothetical protein FACS1894105_03760 [Clostridia bacterium]|nr:hypothetical protein FACS1894105_03760 [Clostridia bacterium]
MLNVKNEISRVNPVDTPRLPEADGIPIVTALGCVIFEHHTDKGFIYTAINLTSLKKKIMSRRIHPLDRNGVEALVEKLSHTGIARAGILEADRPAGEQISVEKTEEITNAVFHNILPEYGYNVRAEQVSLANHLLQSINNHSVTLAEAETGTGKTLAYLVPAIIAKRGRLNDFRNMSIYPDMQYSEMPKMPIVIATSSIALQQALLTEYIPELSRILLERGIIKTPLTAILRKGREHYICERRLRAYLPTVSDKVVSFKLNSLLLSSGDGDLAEVTNLDNNIKNNISVSGRCFNDCPHRESCRYLDFVKRTKSNDIDIQVSNHNYILADTKLRADSRKPLIPNYQMLIIDEAHKFLSAARSMYGSEFSNTPAPDMLNSINDLVFSREGLQSRAKPAAKKLSDESVKLFRELIASAKSNANTDEETDRFNVNISAETSRHLINIREISGRLILILRDEAVFLKARELLQWVKKKYCADISPINLRSVFRAITADCGNRHDQDKAIHAQMDNLCKMICQLSAVRLLADAEKFRRHEKERSLIPDRQIVREESSAVFDDISAKAHSMLPIEKSSGRSAEKIIRLIRTLEQILEQADEFTRRNELICWLETDVNMNRPGEINLCAIPKNLNDRLFTDQWSKAIPVILTSGTLSANGDFSHIKRTLGLDRLETRLTETSKPSLFCHRENALLYISETVPFPDRQNADYITSAANETERLIRAAHGHTAVLFTSYKVMDMVWERLAKRKMPFPMFRLGKGDVNAIERFKKSGNGVLFASGALWEGIDIPGDILSMLVIVKLPFAIPDPIGEYERTLFKDMTEYKNCVIVPEMLIKLKQGFGRLIRNENDTGVVAILDCRVNGNGAYRRRVLDALPDCRVTDNIFEVERFIIEKKSPEYFL